MQKLVDEVNGAARDTGKFGRVEDHLIKSAQKDEFPLHYAWERQGNFDQPVRGSLRDADMTARFAIVVLASGFTFSELEDLWKSVIAAVKDAEAQDADFFDAQFGNKRVRIALYQMQLDTDICF